MRTKNMSVVAIVAMLVLPVGGAGAQSGAVMPPPGPYRSTGPDVPVAAAGIGRTPAVTTPQPAPARAPAWLQSVQQPMPYWMQPAPAPRGAPDVVNTGAADTRGQGGAGFSAGVQAQYTARGNFAPAPVYGGRVVPGYFPGYRVTPQAPDTGAGNPAGRTATGPMPQNRRYQMVPSRGWGGGYAPGFWPNGPWNAFNPFSGPVYTPYGYGQPYQPYRGWSR